MKRNLVIAYAILAPLAVAGGIVVKLLTDDVSDPILFVLIAVAPATIISALKEWRSIMPPDRLLVHPIDQETKAKHWTDYSKWQNWKSRDVTSVYMVLRLENRDLERDIVVFDAGVADPTTGAELLPPRLVMIEVAGKKHATHLFAPATFGRQPLFNAGQKATIGPTSVVDVDIIVQELGVHRDRYELHVTFRDNFRRTYDVPVMVDIPSLAGWDQPTSEWST